MSKFDDYQQMRREIEAAREWAINGEGRQWVCRVLVEYDRQGDSNSGVYRHPAPRMLAGAMDDLLRKEFPAFCARAITAMEQKARLALVAAKAEAEDVIAYKEGDQ